MIKNKNLLGVICVLVCQFLFGFSFLFTKTLTESVSPMTLLSWRFIIAFLVLNICVLTHIIKVDFKNKSISPLFWVAIFHPVLYFIGETLGIKLTTTSESGAIIACVPIVTVVLSALILKESTTKLQVFGISITAAGIIVIVLMKGLEASFNPIGYAMLLLAVVSYSLFAVFSQKAVEFTSAEKTYAMITSGTIAFTSVALVENAKHGTLKEFAMLPFTNVDFLISVLYLGIGCSVVAFLLYNTAIACIGTNRSASFVGICTIVTVVAGIVILKEKFSILQGIGTVLVLGGVYLANIAPKSNKSEEIEPTQTIPAGR
jgi:drug/metabolite transporter (DMT)-like permease